MANFGHKNQNAYFTYQGKIYSWSYRSEDSQLTVKKSGEDLFSYKVFWDNSKVGITNEFVIARIEDYKKYGTPTPDINKSEQFDGIDPFYPD